MWNGGLEHFKRTRVGGSGRKKNRIYVKWRQKKSERTKVKEK